MHAENRQPWTRPLLQKVVAMLILMTVAATGRAEGPLDRYEAREFAGRGDYTLKYRLLKPKDYDPEKQYPLMLFLHGAGERGDDNKAQLVHGAADFASDDVMQKHPAFVVAPQCPRDEKWSDVDWSADSHTLPPMPSPSMQATLDLLESLQQEFSIDPDRLYITGLSMGGYGVWDAIQRRPVTFAAAAPVCGGGDPSLARSINHVPIWCFHGADDNVVKPQRSRAMIEALKKADASPEPKYTEYEGVGHNSWSKAYSNRELYDWMFSQKRDRGD